MAAASRDQALSLLAAANNHGDLAVKLSSLKQVRGILSSADPSLAAELFPYLVELQSSPEILVRKSLIEIIEDTGLKAMEYSYVLMPVLLAFLRDDDSSVIGKSIVCGTHFFCRVVEEGTLQFHWHGKVERWLEELWTWMLRFKDVVFAIVLEDRPGLVGRKLLALKFLETYVLLFTSDKNDFEKCNKEGSKRTFNISWLLAGHPFLDPLALTSEANRLLGTLMDLLQSACNLPGSVTITIVNCLAAIGRKRPLHYSTIFSALLEFSPNFEIAEGCHTASVLYSLRTAFLGFLRCTNPTILESRDKLLKALGAMNAGDAADQAVRQVDKMIRNSERAREIRLGRDDQPSTQLPLSGDLLRKRSMPQDNEEQNNGLDAASKRVRYGPNSHLALSAPINDSRHESVSLNGVSPNIPLLDSDLTPVEKMISMIAALLAEGERGAESLELLISNMHPDLLADIVITNMKHLPKIPPPLTRRGNLPVTLPISSVNSPAHVAGLSSEINTTQSPLVTAQVEVPPSVASFSSSLSDSCCTSAADSKRDPRRDPRRLDPRRLATPVGVPSVPTTEDVGPNPMQSDFNDSSSITRPPSLDVMAAVENFPAPVITGVKSDDMTFVSPAVSKIDQLNLEEGLVRSKELITVPEVSASLDHEIPSCAVNEDSAALDLSDAEVNGTNVPSLLESDQHSSAVSIASAWEETCKDLPPLPIFVELTEEEQKSVRKLAVQRIFESYKHLHGTECQTRMGLLARLIAQLDADEDIVTMLQKCVVLDYQEQKGHELVLHILYHLQSLMISSSSPNSSYASAVYGKLLLAVAKSLLDTFPASDKSFSRLLGEVPVLPDSVLELLNNLCFSALFDLHGKEVPDGERVTQGLGAVWSLILGRPNYRQACLDIALKCAAHSQDEIRAKAIRLVSNKLYQLSYLRENIEQYATNMMISAVNQHSSKLEQSQSGSADLRAEVVGSQETSISGSQVSEPGTFEMDSVMQAQPISHSALTVSFPEAQRLTSLFFALCTKKPSLLQLIFDNYVQAPKSVKQAFHRHIPILIRALGSSCSELLNIISNPPQGSENLLTLVLQVLTQETTPSPNLIATVKHLYETKLKDATILIPMLSSLTKNEVLPIFPRLVDLPLEKFQMALAHILQGSAHTGPALTPVEVLVAIHDIVPEKDGLPLKKITDACSACFEQRTVFTQQVLAKALNQMVDQTPLPLLFMRTVIQAIDAFPTLVDFVMEILSKLVSKQVWRMPKLWVGFLKCVSQTRPHSFPVLLKLPPPQLESTLNKYANLRGPLAAYASQPSLKSSIPRSTLALLGLGNDSHMQQPHISSLNPSDTGSSVHGQTLT